LAYVPGSAVKKICGTYVDRALVAQWGCGGSVGDVVAQWGFGGSVGMWWLSGDVVAQWGCDGSVGIWWLR
jgi:hypothetical protein